MTVAENLKNNRSMLLFLLATAVVYYGGDNIYDKRGRNGQQEASIAVSQCVLETDPSIPKRPGTTRSLLDCIKSKLSGYKVSTAVGFKDATLAVDRHFSRRLLCTPTPRRNDDYCL